MWILLFSLLLPQTFAQTPAPSPVPQLSRIVWVWLENMTTNDMSGQDFIKGILKKFPAARFSNFHPTSTVTQANVFAQIAGQDFGIVDNNLTRISTPSLVDLFQQNNIPWKVYAEDFPGSCNLTAGLGNYKRYRVPFLSLSSVQSDPWQCMKVLDLAKWDEDSQYGNLASVSVIIPNLVNGGATSNAKTADASLRVLLKHLTDSTDLMANTTLIISSINQSTANAQNFLMFFGQHVQNGGVIADSYTTYNLLRTIEDGFRLGNLGQNDVSAKPILGFWK